MIAGRAIAVSYHKKNKKRRLEERESLSLEDQVGIEDVVIMEDRSKEKNTITFRRIPYAIWIFGALVTMVGLFLLYAMVLGEETGVILKGYQQGYWWQFLISIMILLLGIAIVLTGTIEYIKFDKKNDRLTIGNKNMFCRLKAINYKLSDISSMTAVKKGHQGINLYTIQYKLRIEFHTRTPLKILDTVDWKKIKREVLYFT